MFSFQRKIFYLSFIFYFILKNYCFSFANDVQQNPPVRIIQNDQQELKIRIEARDYQIKNKKIGNELFQTVKLPDFSQTLEPGTPQLPVKSFLFAVPLSGKVDLQIELSEPLALGKLKIPISPRLKSDNSVFKDGNVKLSSASFTSENIKKTSQISSPSFSYRTVELDTSIYLRGMKLGRVRFYPVKYIPQTGETQIFTSATITLQFSQDKTPPQSMAYNRFRSEPFEKLLREKVINYDQAKKWKGKFALPRIKIKNYYNFSENDWYKIFINDDGIYRIYRHELESAGLNLNNIDPQYIHIYNKGKELPIFVRGQDDAYFDASDYIEFFGAGEKGRFTNNNIYWLTISDVPGKRIQLCDSKPDSTVPIVKRSIYKKHYEKNLLYYTSIPNGDYEDHWFWEKLTAPMQKEIEFYLDEVVDISSLPCLFTIQFRGVTYMPQNPDHHVKIFINGDFVSDVKWDGRDKRQVSVAVPQSVFRAGKNILTIDLPGDTEAAADVVLLNWFRVEYWRNHNANNDFFGFWGKDIPGTFHYEITNLHSSEILVYDISDSLDPRKFTNFRYEEYGDSWRLTFQDSLVSRHYLALSPDHILSPLLIEKDHFSQLLSRNNQADYLIITHRNFEQNLAPLANLRQSQGLSVATIRVDDIYDEFNYGIKDPAAIREFLKYTYYHWSPPAPTYVLLVGDASYDYKNYTGNSLADYMPTYLFESATVHMETSSDNWFVCLQGEDNLPEMFIGRLPVRNNNVLDLIVQKILNYETSPEPGRWNRKTIFVADNKDNGGPFEDVSESFISNFIPDNFDVLRVFLRNYPSEEAARNTIVQGINYGCFLVNYLGHGSPDTWAKENIFNKDDVLTLDNGNKLPIVITMSCMNGYFQHAQTPSCLAEEFLNSSMGGAIACISPSGFGYTVADQYLGDGLFQALFQERDKVLGSVVVKGKISIFASAGQLYSDHIDFYNLFGDPALRLNTPSPSFEIAPEWNLISLPRAPSNNSIDSVLKSIQGKWQKIMTYENNRWLGADAQIPREFWTLKELKLGKGYWLQSISGGEVSADGTDKNSLILLNAGWNLIGFPGAEKLKLHSALKTVDGNWEKIIHYKSGQWYGADANLPDQFWTLENMKPGAGYWLKVDRPDTLIFSKIPGYENDEPQNQPMTSASPILRKLSPGATIVQTDPDEYYKLTVPMPSGYFGKVFVRNLPAPPGTRISAWIDGKYLPPDAVVQKDGKYNLFLVAGDDPQTPQIEGAHKGEEIIFKIHLPTGEMFQSDTRGIWEEAINHRVDLFALSDLDSLKTPVEIQFKVNDKIVNEEIISGDPIPWNSEILIKINSPQTQLQDSDVKIYLDEKIIPEDQMKIQKSGNLYATQFLISLKVENLNEGEHTLKALVENPALFPNEHFAEYQFRIFKELQLEKVVNFPNPMQNDTKFTYYILNDIDTDVAIKIYTISGRLIRTIHGASGQVGYNETYWDGTDEFGDPIANGVYFYKIIASDGTKKIEFVEKLVKIQ